MEKRKIELFCCKIESFAEIKLKTTPWRLINKAWLEKRLKFGDIKGSAIVIKVDNQKKVSKLCAKGLKFRRTLKIVEKYSETRPSLVYITCSSIKYDWLEEHDDKIVQYVICVELLVE